MVLRITRINVQHGPRPSLTLPKWKCMINSSLRPWGFMSFQRCEPAHRWHSKLSLIWSAQTTHYFPDSIYQLPKACWCLPETSAKMNTKRFLRKTLAVHTVLYSRGLPFQSEKFPLLLRNSNVYKSLAKM